ncbi:SWIM zinc finger family protein [Pseudomonas hunanensis]
MYFPSTAPLPTIGATCSTWQVEHAWCKHRAAAVPGAD